MNYTLIFGNKKLVNLTKNDAKDWTAYLQEKGVNYKLIKK